MVRGHHDDLRLRDAQRVLAMVAELHRLGYQNLRVVPGMSPSGLDWRCDITPVSNLTGPHQLDLKESDQLVARYTTGQGSRWFGWSEVDADLDPRGLAGLFVERFAPIVSAGKGTDLAYATWFQQVVDRTGQGVLPVAYSDWDTDTTEFLPVISARSDASGEGLPLPPMPRPLDEGPRIEVDLAATRSRTRRLQRYVTQHLLTSDDFICPAYAACSTSVQSGDVFREGTMSHLGRRYDLQVEGKPLRIVVVGQESGFPKGPHLQHLARRVSLVDRYHQVHDDAGLKRRYYTDPDHAGRNPHMRGTTSALRLLIGKEPGSDYDDEIVHPAAGMPFHLFDGFALVNRLLCSASPKGSSTGHPTREMFTNCGNHFAATLAILQPTLVILQGRAVARGARSLLPPLITYSETLYESQINAGRVLVCSLSHPSAHGSQRWGDRPDAPYLTDVVAPTLREALIRL